MAQSSERTGPPFHPIEVDPQAPLYRSCYKSLQLLQDPTFNSYLPYAWGFTIYCIRFEGDSDERFAEGIRRFNEWSKWLVRTSRYTEGPSGVTTPEPPPTNYSTDHLADRFYNEVVYIDPTVNTVVTGPEGQEDFSAIGKTFSQWIASLDVDSTRYMKNARYDQCLIIDKKSLETLELLPEVVPPLDHGNPHHPQAREVFHKWYPSWVWVLDRETCEAFLRGQKTKYPPWLRLHLQSFLDMWFGRVKGKIPTDWQELAEEDSDNWETVFWWSPGARATNEMNRDMRASGFVGFREDETLYQEMDELLKELLERKEKGDLPVSDEVVDELVQQLQERGRHRTL